MSLQWVNKIDGEDDVLAEDINAIAAEVIRLDNEKADASNIEGKADISYVDNEIRDLYNTLDVEKANKTDIPTKVSQLDNDVGYLTKHQDISGKADISYVDSKTESIWEEIDYISGDYAERTRIVDISYEDIVNEDGKTEWWHLMTTDNFEFRLPELNILSIEFEDAEYDRAYMSSFSFDSGAIPTSINYTNSGILNWVGTDCSMTNDGLSIFQPSANTHYDIVFYFNGRQFIGLVNGYVSSMEWQSELPTGNEAV